MDKTTTIKHLFLVHFRWTCKSVQALFQACYETVSQVLPFSTSAPLCNMLLIVAGSFCLDATSTLSTHMLMTKASTWPILSMGPTEGTASDVTKDAEIYSSYRGGQEMDSYEKHLIYPRTIQAGAMWIIIKFFPAGFNFRRQYFQLKWHWDMALSCIYII